MQTLSQSKIITLIDRLYGDLDKESRVDVERNIHDNLIDSIGRTETTAMFVKIMNERKRKKEI